MALAIIIGAFGAHGLKGLVATGQLTGDQLNSFEVGVRYQVYHSLALVVMGFGLWPADRRWWKWSASLFTVGIVLFSGSIYFLALRDVFGLGDGIRILGAVTPIGGICFITGWLLFMIGAIRYKKED